MQNLHLFRTLLFVVAVAMSMSACNTSSTTKEVISLGEEATADEPEYIFDRDVALAVVNAARINHRLATVKADERLILAAQTHADLMGKTGRFGHEFGPDTKFKKRIFAVGFVNSAGENIGVGYKNINEAVEGWLNSPGHRKILLKKRYNAGGIAFARNTSGRNKKLDYFWVLILGENRESDPQG